MDFSRAIRGTNPSCAEHVLEGAEANSCQLRKWDNKKHGSSLVSQILINRCRYKSCTLTVTGAKSCKRKKPLGQSSLYIYTVYRQFISGNPLFNYPFALCSRFSHTSFPNTAKLTASVSSILCKFQSWASVVSGRTLHPPRKHVSQLSSQQKSPQPAEESGQTSIFILKAPLSFLHTKVLSNPTVFLSPFITQ